MRRTMAIIAGAGLLLCGSIGGQEIGETTVSDLVIVRQGPEVKP